MKKYVFYIVIVAILLTIVLVLVFNDKPGTITGTEKNFAINDTSSITRIRYVQKGQVMELTRNNSGWVLNRKYAAKPQFVSLTLKFLQQFNVISSVPKESLQKAIEALNEKSMQVTIEALNKPLMQYRFSEIDTAPSKAYIIMEGSAKPFIANITGFDLPLFTLFSTSESMWRDRKVFVTPVSDMIMVGLAYPQTPDKSFAIYRINDSLQLKQGDETLKNISREAVQNYFLSVTRLNADKIGLETNEFNYATFKNNIPFAELIVKNTNNRMETLKIYQISDKKKPKGVDPDKLIGLVGSDTVPVVFKYIDFDPLLKVKEDFVGK
jgi:hypothetical protein